MVFNTAAGFTAVNPVLEPYQTGRETDTGKEKTGPGAWNDLDYDTPDGSPFTADAIADLPNEGAPPSTGLIPFSLAVEEVQATAAGSTAGAGTFQVNASGYIDITDVPADGDVLPAINGVSGITMSDDAAALGGFPYVQIGADETETAEFLAAAINANHVGRFEPLAQVVCDGDGAHLNIVAMIGGADGNAITIGADAGVFERSAATLQDGVDAGTITVGNNTYTVVEDATDNPLGIEAGSDDETFAANIAAVITRDSAETLCECVATLAVLDFTANAGLGAAGNDIPISTTDPNLTLDAEFVDGVTGENVLENIAFSDL